MSTDRRRRFQLEVPEVQYFGEEFFSTLFSCIRSVQLKKPEKLHEYWLTQMSMDARTELDPKYIEEFVLNGIVVIPSIITPDLVEKTMRELEAFLLDQGCNPNNLEGTASTLSKLSSTNGSGGVLDVYYEAWKLRLNENPNIVGAVQSLWKHTYSSYVDDFQRNICHCRDPSEDQFITGVYPCTRKAQKSSVKVPIDNKCTCTSTCIHSGKLTTSNDHFDITGITNDKAAELTYTKGDSVSVGASAVLSSSPPEKINSSSCSLGMKSSMSVTSRSNGNHHPFEHPFGTFNASQRYMYIDRICYRIPTVYASNVGTGSTSYTCHSINTTCTGIEITGGKPETPTMNTGINTGTQASAPINTVSNSNSNNSSSSSSSSSSDSKKKNQKKQKKQRPLQRSLTPHLDCCPHDLYGDHCGGAGESTRSLSKWRPIQCFVALTDTLNPEEGGFEACPGLHREFQQWTERRKGSSTKNDTTGTGTGTGSSGSSKPPPCVGDFTPIRPIEDREIIERFRHIPCRAGDLVCWDYRIPHANSRYNHSSRSRAVVYIGLLPDVPLNQQYAAQQLAKYRAGVAPSDQWQEEPVVHVLAARSSSAAAAAAATPPPPPSSSSSSSSSSSPSDQWQEEPVVHVLAARSSSSAAAATPPPPSSSSASLSAEPSTSMISTINTSTRIGEDINTCPCPEYAKEQAHTQAQKQDLYPFTELGEKLMGISPWT